MFPQVLSALVPKFKCLAPQGRSIMFPQVLSALVPKFKCLVPQVLSALVPKFECSVPQGRNLPMSVYVSPNSVCAGPQVQMFGSPSSVCAGPQVQMFGSPRSVYHVSPSSVCAGPQVRMFGSPRSVNHVSPSSVCAGPQVRMFGSPRSVYFGPQVLSALAPLSWKVTPIQVHSFLVPPSSFGGFGRFCFLCVCKFGVAKDAGYRCVVGWARLNGLCTAGKSAPAKNGAVKNPAMSKTLLPRCSFNEHGTKI